MPEDYSLTGPVAQREWYIQQYPALVCASPQHLPVLSPVSKCVLSRSISALNTVPSTEVQNGHEVGISFFFFFFQPHCATCGILVPWPGIEPAPPVLEGGVLTTGPPGKSCSGHLLNECFSQQQCMVNSVHIIIPFLQMNSVKTRFWWLPGAEIWAWGFQLPTRCLWMRSRCSHLCSLWSSG